MDWSGLSKERIDLKLPLLIVKAPKGFLACGYIHVETCNKTGEACAIVTGVKTHDEMLTATVRAVSDAAGTLGLHAGISGREALALLR